MKRYIFNEIELTNEYQYIFLCGSHYVISSAEDKRNVLRDYLKRANVNYRPIILEDNFMFKNDSSRFLRYDDVYMKDLYQVEMITNYLADKNLIIHESISTGAETGLFLSEESSLGKTCLLIPDETAIEENKLGQFIRLAFFRGKNSAEMIKYYPRVEKKVCSEDVKYWHTYFWKDRIGENLGGQILGFIEKESSVFKIKFTKNKEKLKEGFIHYKKKNNTLEITLLPRILLNCIGALFNIKEFSKKIFNAEEKELKDYIEQIRKCLYQVFIQTVEEMTGETFKYCSIRAQMNVKCVYISGMIGMCLYLFQAAEFINIVKADDYTVSNKVKITRKMVTYQDGTEHYFYDKYVDCIGCAVDTQII